MVISQIINFLYQDIWLKLVFYIKHMKFGIILKIVSFQQKDGPWNFLINSWVDQSQEKLKTLLQHISPNLCCY